MNLRILGIVLLVSTGIFFVSSVHAVAGDINGDGKVNMRDVNLVISAFNSYPGSPRWNPACDVFSNDTRTAGQDGIVNMRDLNFVVMNFG